MVCLYKTDFKALGGFSKTITGWGREDVDFYDRTVKTGTVEVCDAVYLPTLRNSLYSSDTLAPLSLTHLGHSRGG